MCFEGKGKLPNLFKYFTYTINIFILLGIALESKKKCVESVLITNSFK